MGECSNLYVLSAIACSIAKCLPPSQMNVLSADLVVLSDMLANIATRRQACGQDDTPSDTANDTASDTANDEN